VWGIPCTEIKAEWAAQRIKGLSLTSALRAALLPRRNNRITTLINSFHYPRRGPGMLWERIAGQVQQHGHRVLLESEVVALRVANRRVQAVVSRNGAGTFTVAGRHFISTMPLSELTLKIEPPPPPEVVHAAKQLSYRDFLTVALIVRRDDLFPDNWIYVHSPDVQVGRIQNFKNWSPEMIPAARPGTSCIGLEYFCAEGDWLWQMPDAELVSLGRRELAALNLAAESDVVDGVVYRQPKAYPVYSGEYQSCLDTIRAYLDSLENLQTAGRNGLHKYNNQDHSMLTAMLAVENILGAQHNLWAVNTERSYYEEVRIPQQDS